MKKTISTPSYSIVYEGNIEVKVLRNKKVIRERKFKNNGRWPLFSHLVNALAGKYDDAEKDRPLVVTLYSVPYGSTVEGNIPEIEDKSPSVTHHIYHYANPTNIRSGSPGMFMTTPKITITPDAGIGTAQITYDFLVPFTSLIFKKTEGSGWDYTVDPFNLVCLYSKNNFWGNAGPGEYESTYGNPSAFFFVPETEGSTKLGSLLPKNISASSNEYSLEIKWTLQFSNKTTETSNSQVLNSED